MDETALLPRPRVFLPLSGKGVTVGAGTKPVAALGHEIAVDPVGVARRMGFTVEPVAVQEMSARTGLLPPVGFEPGQGYALRIESGTALIGCDTPSALFCASQTLAQVLVGARQGVVPPFQCWDWPRMSTRGFSLCYHLVGESLPLMAPGYEAALHAIEWFSHLKMNALILEIEALFPFRKHPAMPDRIAFSREQIAGLRAACGRGHVQVIPLIQSIGHAYAVLRHAEYAHLRELPDTSQQYCLCNEDIPRFYDELAGELIDAFGCTRLHIGGDESRRLGQCPMCREKAARDGIGALYAEHVNRIGERLHRRGVIPVVWGDIMEDHPGILDRLDPAIEIISWNYDIVDWNRPYALETFVRPGRVVYTGTAARFGPHGDATFLYQKSMRNAGLLARETERLGLAGMFVTDWTKLAPFEVGMVATSLGAEEAWSGAGSQEEFCNRWSRLFYGERLPGLDLFYRLVSETTTKRKEALNPHWAPPFVDQTRHYMPDWLDRMDWSAWSFDQVLAWYTQQEVVEDATVRMKAGLARARQALTLAEKHASLVVHNRRIFDAVRLAALNQEAKCSMGLALTRAAQLLKYPRPADDGLRRAAADALRAALRGWAALREETRRALLPGTFAESLECALRYKVDPSAEEHARRFIELLESGKALRGLLDGSAW